MSEQGKMTIFASVQKFKRMGHLTKEQRYTIFVMKQQGCKINFIASTIGKDKSVVSRELKRNCDKRSGQYNDDLAQRKYEKRMQKKTKKIRFTQAVRERVEELLREDFSPEQIAGRCELEGLECISHERIYQHIWEDKKRGGGLHTHLRRKGRRYRKRGASRDNRGIISNRIGIENCPVIVEQRSRFGDLEIDTMIGKNHKGALLTINDRAIGICWLALLEGKEAKPLTKAMVDILSPIKDLLHTATADNGKEFSDHQQIASSLKIDVYFARPYHSWERGSNENLNGLIRQFIPKGSSFENLTEEDVKMIQDKLNNRPRKRLGYLTPLEFFSNNFAKSNQCLTEKLHL